jgi:hypothetical protein
VLVKNHAANGMLLSNARPGAFVNLYQPWFEITVPSVQGMTLLTTLVEHEPHPSSQATTLTMRATTPTAALASVSMANTVATASSSSSPRPMDGPAYGAVNGAAEGSSAGSPDSSTTAEGE